MTDEYLEWLEEQIASVSDARRQYTLDGTRMPKLARDFERILETLEACKSKYLGYKNKGLNGTPLKFIVDYCVSSYVSDGDAEVEKSLIADAFEAWENWGKKS